MLDLTSAGSAPRLPGLLSPVLSWLHGLDAQEARALPSFDRRRLLLLRLGGALMLVNALPWGLFFWAHRLPLASAVDALVCLAALSVLGMARLRLLRVASLLLLLSCLLSVIVQALMADVPTPGLPRTLQLFLLPLAVLATFLLQNEGRGLRAGLPILILSAFALLVTTSTARFGFSPLMSDEQRHLGGIVNGVATSIMIFLCLRVMLNEARESSALERDFAHAVAAGELEVYLQPQCSSDGHIVGAEALMRWRHPQRGYISPAEFIPMAEQSGLIVPAGEFVLKQVCSALERWTGDPALEGIAVAVNVSAAQLFAATPAHQLSDLVPGSLGRSGRIKFELTESIFVNDFSAVRELMEGLRGQGIRISLDDFGTGFSSLSYLKKLPLDQLKIDQAFVRDLPEDERSGKIALTIVQLGKDLGFEVVAEGVEKAAQVEALLAMGCGIFQGFLYSRPVPLAEFERLAADVHAGRLSLMPRAAQVA